MIAHCFGHAAGISVTGFVYVAERAMPPLVEVYDRQRIIVVYDGTFQCRTARAPVTLVPGAVMLANPGCAYEYSYDRSWGDRCISFAYEQPVLEEIVRDCGLASPRFGGLSLPPNARFAALARLLLAQATAASPEEWAYALAAEVLQTPATTRPRNDVTHVERRRAIEACKLIEQRASEPLSLATLATTLGLSRFHFLRSFKRVIGLTPHQYLVQTRLRHAAAWLLETPRPILEIALASGFSDLANFNRSFRSVMGCSPRQLRRRDPTVWRRQPALRALVG
jgi:AraC-like DNA-binding protein